MSGLKLDRLLQEYAVNIRSRSIMFLSVTSRDTCSVTSLYWKLSWYSDHKMSQKSVVLTEENQSFRLRIQSFEHIKQVSPQRGQDRHQY